MSNIQPPDANRERILVFGPPGAGKSRTYIDIYNRITGHMYVTDTDIALRRMFGDQDQSRLTYNECHDYEESAKALSSHTKEAKEGDWVIIDLLTPTWAWCQDYWALKRGKVKPGTDLSMWLPIDNKDFNWSEINRMYTNFMSKLMSTKAHVLVVAEETDVMEGKFEGDTDRLFKEFGTKPRGQKRVPYMFHTAMHMGTKNFKSGTEYRVSVPKERVGRECDWVDEDFTDHSFVDDYLIDVAGWTEETKRRRRK